MTNKEELLSTVEFLEMLDKETYKKNYYCTAAPIVFDNMRYILNKCPNDTILEDCEIGGSLNGTLLLSYSGDKHFMCDLDVGERGFSYSIWNVDNDITETGQSSIKDNKAIERFYLALEFMNQKN